MVDPAISPSPSAYLLLLRERECGGDKLGALKRSGEESEGIVSSGLRVGTMPGRSCAPPRPLAPSGDLLISTAESSSVREPPVRSSKSRPARLGDLLCSELWSESSESLGEESAAAAAAATFKRADLEVVTRLRADGPLCGLELPASLCEGVVDSVDVSGGFLGLFFIDVAERLILLESGGEREASEVHDEVWVVVEEAAEAAEPVAVAVPPAVEAAEASTPGALPLPPLAGCAAD